MGAVTSVRAPLKALSVIVACRQAPAQGTSDHICFSSALRLHSVDPEKVLLCCCWMWDFDQSALNSYMCVCTCTSPPTFSKHKMLSSPADPSRTFQFELSHNMAWKESCDWLLGRAEAHVWFPDVQYEEWRALGRKMEGYSGYQREWNSRRKPHMGYSKGSF